MKLTRILLTFNNCSQIVTIESIHGLHELEIHTQLQKIMPAYFDINFEDKNPENQGGYSYTYKNGLKSVLTINY